MERERESQVERGKGEWGEFDMFTTTTTTSAAVVVVMELEL